MKKIRNIIISISIILFLGWVYYTNVSLGFTNYALSFKTLPQSFVGFKIAHISDFHNATFGNKTESILQGMKDEKPNIIVITGDLVDSRTTNVAVALDLVADLSEIAPCFYVTGNHEARLDDSTYRELEEGLERHGVVVLRDRGVLLTQGDEKLSLVGIDDPLYAESTNGIAKTMATDKINALSSEGLFTIMLSHRPEYYEAYKKTDVNLVLAGHAHGGQFRLPFIGAFFAPSQGFFPKYVGGVYQENEFAMVVSRGIGNSIIPIRFNNQPEVVMIELRN